MADIVPLPADLKKIVKSFLMPSIHDVSIRRLAVLDEVRVVEYLILPGEHIPVADLVEYITVWRWRPMLTRS